MFDEADGTNTEYDPTYWINVTGSDTDNLTEC